MHHHGDSSLYLLWLLFVWQISLHYRTLTVSSIFWWKEGGHAFISQQSYPLHLFSLLHVFSSPSLMVFPLALNVTDCTYSFFDMCTLSTCNPGPIFYLHNVNTVYIHSNYTYMLTKRVTSLIRTIRFTLCNLTLHILRGDVIIGIVGQRSRCFSPRYCLLFWWLSLVYPSSWILTRADSNFEFTNIWDIMPKANYFFQAPCNYHV